MKGNVFKKFSRIQKVGGQLDSGARILLSWTPWRAYAEMPRPSP